MKEIKVFKYINIKKNLILCIMSALSLIMICTLAFVAYGKMSEQNGRSKTSKTIIIDAGHGGEDGGAVGIDGIIEKDINLSVALKLQNFLEASGYNIIMIREKDEAIYDESSESLREKKRSDLRNRVKIIKDNSSENNIFVSIHQNKFSDSKYFGTQLFYSKNNPKSVDLANNIKESVVGLIQPENTREIKPANSKIFLLNNAQLPAVVVECGFLSNKEDAKKLGTEEYQNKIAFCIYCGIVNYFLNNA